MKLKNYFEELKRRHVFKAGIAYLIVAWLIAQIASLVLPAFEAPPYILKILLFVLLIGFPVNLIISWIYDVTPEGIKKTKSLDEKSYLKKFPFEQGHRLLFGTGCGGHCFQFLF